jgi:hypothetical protein
MRKGDLVKVNADRCFTRDSGGKREFPLGNYYYDEKGIVQAHRPTTATERNDWYKTPAAQGMNSAGESKLPPQCVTVEIPRDAVLVVERARCRVRLGWGNAKGGYAKVMLPNGETAYLKRELLAPAV